MTLYLVLDDISFPLVTLDLDFQMSYTKIAYEEFHPSVLSVISFWCYTF
jgi:hypothetical protein